jgi:hypothetical protein
MFESKLIGGLFDVIPLENTGVSVLEGMAYVISDVVEILNKSIAEEKLDESEYGLMFYDELQGIKKLLNSRKSVSYAGDRHRYRYHTASENGRTTNEITVPALSSIPHGWSGFGTTVEPFSSVLKQLLNREENTTEEVLTEFIMGSNPALLQTNLTANGFVKSVIRKDSITDTAYMTRLMGDGPEFKVKRGLDEWDTVTNIRRM